ncbi:hypothetical protein M513_07695 [Trichuris suis]|uniref:Uncharacterized protein n=1 Tax=Trichuris suis TaxID=68888 RepID=A0A085M2N6_9BILA|nr:hypothetical protein M513_07695 [Trichuris suis]
MTTDGSGMSAFVDHKWPQPTENASIVVLVKLLTIGAHGQTDYNRINFNRILDRLRSMGYISVSENPPRLLRPRFIIHPKRCRPAWGELQCHRKILGFIGVAFASKEPTTVDEDRWIACFKEARSPFEMSLLDSRLALFDHSPSLLQSSEEHCLYYCALSGYAGLENDVKDFVKSLFWVLESRRLDVSYLKMENPPFPKVPGEEKYTTVLDVSKRTLKKRCIGRWKKQIADYTLMTGLASLAMQEYEGAIELLKPTGDYLWLAAALEGYACAATVVAFGHVSTTTSLVRVNTFSEGDFKRASNIPWRSQSGLVDSKYLSHRLSSQQILDTFVQAIANYKKLPFATKLELECVFKAAHLLAELKTSCFLDQFFTLSSCKFLDDDYKQISDEEKARICWWMAHLYLRTGFRRKYAFYCRLAALFFISHNECQPNGMDTYRTVYPLLLKALDSYTKGINSATDTETYYGWPGVQVNILHEVHVAALRADYKEASIRHLLFLLQNLYASLEPLKLHQYCSELSLLCSHNPVAVNKPLQVSPAILLPPISITSLPRVMSIRFKSLCSDHEVEAASRAKPSNVFIYTPFEDDALNKECLIAGRATIVEVTLANPTSIALQISNFSLCCDGVAFSVEPSDLTIPANATTVRRLRGKASEAGCLKIIGYSFQILGVISVCRLESIAWVKPLANRSTQVLPEIPFLDVRAVGEKGSTHPIRQSLYAGQTVRIEMKLTNSPETEPIRDIQATIERPIFQGCGTCVSLEVEPTVSIDLLGPKEFANFYLIASCHDRFDSGGRTTSGTSLAGPESLPTSAVNRAATHCTILQVEYTVSSKSEKHKSSRRRAIRPIELTIRPAVIIRHWAILAGESWLTRHLAIDLYNATDDDVDLHITAEKKILILSGDSCRVPILVNCYQWPTGDVCRSEVDLETPFERSDLCQTIQEHVTKQIHLRWSSNGHEPQTGHVPLTKLFDNPSLYREFCVPPFLLEVSVDNCETTHLSNNDLSCIVCRPTRIAFRFALLENCSVRVTINLHFFLDLQNGSTKNVDEEVVFLGAEAYVILLCSTSKNAYEEFNFMFCTEGSFQACTTCDCTFIPLTGKAFHYSPLTLPTLNFKVSNE